MSQIQKHPIDQLRKKQNEHKKTDEEKKRKDDMCWQTCEESKDRLHGNRVRANLFEPGDHRRRGFHPHARPKQRRGGRESNMLILFLFTTASNTVANLLEFRVKRGGAKKDPKKQAHFQCTRRKPPNPMQGYCSSISFSSVWQSEQTRQNTKGTDSEAKQ